jgi:hypothetical protein
MRISSSTASKLSTTGALPSISLGGHPPRNRLYPDFDFATLVPTAFNPRKSWCRYATELVSNQLRKSSHTPRQTSLAPCGASFV